MKGIPYKVFYPLSRVSIKCSILSYLFISSFCRPFRYQAVKTDFLLKTDHTNAEQARCSNGFFTVVFIKCKITSLHRTPYSQHYHD